MKIKTLIQRFVLIVMLLVGTLSAFAQQVQVTGVVSDPTGEPVIGASILVVGTTSGTITDFDGNFSLYADKGATLKISYVGYKELTVTVDGKPLNIENSSFDIFVPFHKFSFLY